MSSTLPRVYVVVMGIEKLVPTVEDAFLQYQALCRSATGQQCSVYLSMTSGPRARRRGRAGGVPRVLLDNGRVDMLAKGYGEALCCIRCGACLNVCPVYREIGGHAYGSTYSGPIGAVISPLRTPGSHRCRRAALCQQSVRRVPRRLPGQDRPAALLLDLRRDVVEAGDTARLERMGMQGFLWAMSSRARYAALGGTASFGSNLLAWLSGGQIKALPGPFAGWTDSRNFPPFAKRPFREQFAERQNRRKTIGQ
jgi:L-lactate dehydrogenase complex protein LldF